VIQKASLLSVSETSIILVCIQAWAMIL